MYCIFYDISWLTNFVDTFPFFMTSRFLRFAIRMFNTECKTVSNKKARNLMNEKDSYLISCKAARGCEKD